MRASSGDDCPRGAIGDQHVDDTGVDHGAPGTYTFICDVLGHGNMVGTLTVTD